MYIHEAVSEARRRDCAITRKSEGSIWDYFFIVPTNSVEGCIAYPKNPKPGVKGCPRWQPTAEDLTADDWVLCEKTKGGPKPGGQEQ